MPEILAGEIVLDSIHHAGGMWMPPGRPRTVTQAEMLAGHGQQPAMVIELSLDEPEACFMS